MYVTQSFWNFLQIKINYKSKLITCSTQSFVMKYYSSPTLYEYMMIIMYKISRLHKLFILFDKHYSHISSATIFIYGNF